MQIISNKKYVCEFEVRGNLQPHRVDENCELV